ncbi:homeobox-leucine zipper protein PROTODERMAL FACTOR 2-like [Rhodamnia argentea]|uniref:Homeobox-leucine zipper protein PROTODERMAL FACTOR 2-like n=1 Tax=Rhodamnia argentea TaxID=178133 RepID=A0ABM3HJ32_9MYRT|nr:homeobox-leucine zipper protein PROTODERMAL FACTOR 2-like [Rhodamnia argentea]
MTTETTRRSTFGRALVAMEELMMVAQIEEPSWKIQDDGLTELLRDFEYKHVLYKVNPALQDLFPEEAADNKWGRLPNRPNPSNTIEFLNSIPEHVPIVPTIGWLKTEASRETVVINMDWFRIVTMLMDVVGLNQWSDKSSNIMSRPTLLGVLYPGAGTYDGMLQVREQHEKRERVKQSNANPLSAEDKRRMEEIAEFVQLQEKEMEELVAKREMLEKEYCKQLDWGMWGVVDYSLECVLHCSFIKYQRRPSGRLMQDLPNGSSEVNWVENGGGDHTAIHSIYRPIVSSGFAFGAKHWISANTRQAEWLEILMLPNQNAAYNNANTVLMTFSVLCVVVISQSGRDNLFKLTERMMRTYFKEVNGCASLGKICR